MKSMKVVLILGLVLIAVPAAFAQFQAGLSELDQQLDSLCGETGHPIEDGTIVKIIWDRGAAGPSPEDTIPILCDDPPACDPPNVAGTVNIVSFEMNGRNPDVMGEPGYFNMIENLFNSYGALPSPAQYYLEICLNSVPTRLRSNSFTLTSGYQEVEIASWTCEDSVCGGCEAPARPANFEASDSTSCTGVVLRWDPYSETEVDSFFVYRGADTLARLPVTDTTFTDATADSLVSYLYGIEARRICTDPADTAFSARATDNGSRYPRPQIPTLQTVSTNLCDSIRVTWSYQTNQGLDSFVIKRGGVRVGAIHRGATPGSRTFTHFWATTDTATYTVVGLAIGDAGLMRLGCFGPQGLAWQLTHSVTDDGLWYEGTMDYQVYAMQALIRTLEVAKRVGWDFKDNARLQAGPVLLADPGQLQSFQSVRHCFFPGIVMRSSRRRRSASSAA